MDHWLIGRMGRCLMKEEKKLLRVPAERKLKQSVFPVRPPHPRYPALEKEVMSAWGKTYGNAGWAKDLELLATVDAAPLGALFWPNSQDDKRAMTLIKFMYWIFLVDDAVDDMSGPQAAKFCKRLIRQTFSSTSDDVMSAGWRQQGGALEIPYECHKEPLILAVGLEWWNEMQGSISSPLQRARFVSYFTQHLLAQVGEARFRDKLATTLRLQHQPATGGAELLEEFISIRRAASAFPPCVQMVEYDVGIELDDDTLNNPLHQQLQDAVCDHGSWLNDMISFPKEVINGVVHSLLPLLHMRNKELGGGKQDVSVEVTIEEAWQMAEARQQDCARLARELLHQHHSSHPVAQQPAFQAYVESLCAVTSGNWAWTLQSTRYNKWQLPPASAPAPRQCTSSAQYRTYNATSAAPPICRHHSPRPRGLFYYSKPRRPPNSPASLPLQISPFTLYPRFV